LKVERESQFNTAGSSEFQVRGAAVLNDRLANDVQLIVGRADVQNSADVISINQSINQNTFL